MTNNVTVVAQFMALAIDTRSAFLRNNDPNGLFHQQGFLVGSFDADANGKRGNNEASAFFKELIINDRVYVLSYEKGAQKNEWLPRLYSKQVDGTLTLVPLSDIGGSAVRINSAKDLSDSIERVKRSVVSVSAPRVRGGTVANGELYAGWTRREGRDTNPWTHISADQGTQSNNLPGSRGGFGGGVVGIWEKRRFEPDSKQAWNFDLKGAHGWLHYVTAFESYERFLAGSTQQQDAIPGDYAAGDGRSAGVFKDWAKARGLTIHNDLIVNGDDVMGFSFEKNGVKVTLYWDIETQSHQIAKATRVINGSTVDVTASLLSAQGGGKLGKSWTEVDANLNVPRDLRAEDSTQVARTVGEYGDEFDAVDTSGSALETSEAENQAYADFLSRWGILNSSGGGVSLPTNESDRTRLLAALLELNPRHVLQFFCGAIPGRASGIDTLTSLIQLTELSPDQMQKLAGNLGKMMHLCGHGAAKGDDSKFFIQLSRQLAQTFDALLQKSSVPGVSELQREQVRRAFCAGLLNQSPADPDVEKEPVKAIGLLYQRLAVVARCSSDSHSPAQANKLIEFTEYLVNVFSKIAAQAVMEEEKTSDGAVDSNLAVIAVAAAMQTMWATALGVLVSATTQSSAKDIYDAKLKEKVETYQKIYTSVDQTSRDILEKFYRALEKIV